MQSLERIDSKKYLPTDEDILRVRVPTTGIFEYTFELRKIKFQ